MSVADVLYFETAFSSARDWLIWLYAYARADAVVILQLRASDSYDTSPRPDDVYRRAGSYRV